MSLAILALAVPFVRAFVSIFLSFPLKHIWNLIQTQNTAHIGWECCLTCQQNDGKEHNDPGKDQTSKTQRLIIYKFTKRSVTTPSLSTPPPPRPLILTTETDCMYTMVRYTFLRRSCLPYTKSASGSTSAPIEGQRVERDTEPVKTVFYRHITARSIKLKYWSYFSLCCDLDTFRAQFSV